MKSFLRKNFYNNFRFKTFTEAIKKQPQESKLLSIIKQLNCETKEEKDLRYEDELFYFEKEWKLLQEDKIKKHQDYYTKDITDHQQRECDILINLYNNFSTSELLYFQYLLHSFANKVISTDPHRPNVFEKEKSLKVDLNIPQMNPNQQVTEEILFELLPYISAGYFSGGAAAAVKVETVKEEKVQEKPKEVILLLTIRKLALMLS
jgi:hypothetical protein